MDIRLQKHNLIKTLILRLEFFTHIVPVPIVVYYASLAVLTFSKEYSTFVIITILISALIAAVLMMVLGIILRILKILKIFKIQEKHILKINLLQLPRFEAFVIGFRWGLGVILAYIMIITTFYFVLEEFPLQFILLIIPFLGLPIFFSIIPLEMSSHYLITENIISKFIQYSDLKDIEIPIKNVRINLFQKILVYIISLVGMPMIILISLMSLTYYFGIQLTNPVIHFIILSILSLYPMFQTAYYIAKKMNQGLQQIQEPLEKVASGDFDVKPGILSSDEIGMLSLFINQIILKLKEMYHSIKAMNENLEQIVQIRTMELNTSLEEIKYLKQQQDGDYYLTSLLIEPFIKKTSLNSNTHQSFEYDFIIKQKKTFQFRSIEKEIGGDYCSFFLIHLKNKPYLFFINADAMGKSIQGASGLLVLLAMLKSAIERNTLIEEEQNLYPEIWLKNLFIQMHKTFETFDGSMMVSLIIGLIDIETNSLYFINAEHPYPALIRNQKGRLIKEKHYLRKLGSTIVEGNIYVHTVLLQKDDLFICGSDGKDDIIINDKINEDEELFLQLLQQHDYDPYKTYNYIMNHCGIKDDLSILWIKALKENYLKNNYNEIKKTKELIKNLYSKKENHQLYSILKDYINNVPLDNSMVFLMANICYNLGEYFEAKDHILRLLLRNPVNPWYNYIASKIFLKLNLIQKSEEYYKRAIDYGIESILQRK